MSGYIYTVIIQEFMPFTYLISIIPIESLFLSMGLFMGSFHSHYKLLLDEISELADRNAGKNDINIRIELKRRLIKAIDLHTRAES